MARAHEGAWSIAGTVQANPFSWLANKDKLIAIVDSITDDITDGRLELLKEDSFLLNIAQDYAASVLLRMDEELGWDCPWQTEAMEDALLGFLARRWVYWRVTGRLR